MLRRPLSYLLFDNNRNITILLNNVAVIAQPSVSEIYRLRVSRVLQYAEMPRQTRLCLIVSI
ncbi:hypothetical protein MCEMSEM52_00494 [Burkholderiales bacterium]